MFYLANGLIALIPARIPAETIERIVVTVQNLGSSISLADVEAIVPSTTNRKVDRKVWILD